jgi:hypothetical protein
MRVEAFVVLEFEEGRWTVGRTSELRRRRRRARRGGSELRPSECELGGVCGASGEPIGMHARLVAWPAGPRRVALTTAGTRRSKAVGSAHVRVRGHKAVGPATMTDAWSSP